MLKIVFIYPGYENLGIEYLSAILKKAGHQTYLILDPVLFADSGGINIPRLPSYFNYSKKIIKKILIIKPNLICFSCVSDNYMWALGLARKLKEVFNIPIAFGGIHPTSVPEEVIKQACVDFVCVGECEEAIVELVQELENGNKDFSIKNIWFKDRGSIIANEVRILIEELDTLPFPDKDLYYREYNFMFNGYSIITSRGCPHRCTYCTNSLLSQIYRNKGKYLRRRSIENVIEELKIAREKYHPRFIHFCDEVFTHDKNWLEKFTPLYKKYVKLPFACYTSPFFVDKEVVTLLKESGCYKVQMGVQTLNENRRERILNRYYSNEQIAEAIKLFRRNKIYLTCDNIFGLPGQDEQELIEMAKFYIYNKPDHIEVFWLRYYPRTQIVDIAQSMGLINNILKKNIEEGAITRGIARGGDTYKPGFSKFQLLMNLFHFMPRYLCNFILRKKIYKALPKSSPIFITAFFRLFNKARFDLYTSMTFRRYLYFIKKFFTSNL